MFIDLEGLKQLMHTLEMVRGKYSCKVLRTDKDGNTHYIVPKPRAKGPELRREGVSLEYGPHGSNFVQINPETGEIRCGACADSPLT